eukprot:5673007-Amphidinium_carterae.1
MMLQSVRLEAALQMCCKLLKLKPRTPEERNRLMRLSSLKLFLNFERSVWNVHYISSSEPLKTNTPASTKSEPTDISESYWENR